MIKSSTLKRRRLNTGQPYGSIRPIMQLSLTFDPATRFGYRDDRVYWSWLRTRWTGLAGVTASPAYFGMTTGLLVLGTVNAMCY